jgi:hypothetical protein
VLGLVIEQPDSASRLGRRLVERFRSAQFTRSTAHNALHRLARQGLVRVVADGAGAEGAGARGAEGAGATGPEGGGPIEEHRYEATPLGVEHFRAWLRACSTAAPALREELQAKVEFCAPADLPLLVEAICAEERACASMFAAAQGRLSEAELVAPRRSTAAQQWSALAHRAVLRDEAAMWGMRFKRLERLRARLEEMGDLAGAPVPSVDPARPVEAGGSEPAEGAGGTDLAHPSGVGRPEAPESAGGRKREGARG